MAINDNEPWPVINPTGTHNFFKQPKIQTRYDMWDEQSHDPHPYTVADQVRDELVQQLIEEGWVDSVMRTRELLSYSDEF